MLYNRSLLLLGVISLLTPLGATAQAQDASGLGYAYLFGYGAVNNSAIRSYVPPPPYFSLHPPVYYGQRYARPYGDSPYASWPQLQSAAGYHPKPAAAHAPAVQWQSPTCPMAEQHTCPVVHAFKRVEPLVIDNPFYQAAQAAHLVTSSDSQ